MRVRREGAVTGGSEWRAGRRALAGGWEWRWRVAWSGGGRVRTRWRGLGKKLGNSPGFFPDDSRSTLAGAVAVAGQEAGTGVRPASGSVMAPTTVTEAATSARIAPPSQCSWLTPRARELLTEWRAMQGYSDRVFHRTMQRTNPRNPSGIRYWEEADPVWASPNRIPVIIAATQVPRSWRPIMMCHRRSAPKMKPRKKNSSAIGATTQTNTPAATRAAVLDPTPRL